MGVRALATAFLAVAMALCLPVAAEAAESGTMKFTTAGDFCVSYLPTRHTVCVTSANDMAAARREAVVGIGGQPAAPAVVDAVVHIATLYDNDQYNTAAGYYEITTSADCTVSKTDSNWQNQDLSSIGWSNRISSFHSYGNCQTRLFASTSFGGITYPTTGYVKDSPNVGTAMNDNAESVKWT